MLRQVETAEKPSAKGLPPCADEIGKKGKKMLTQEQKMAVYNAYIDRQNTVGDIAAKFKLQRGEVTRIAVEMGAKPRLEKRYGKKICERANNVRVCPKCRKSIDVNGARFCCFCGSDIRTTKEICIERLKGLMPKTVHLPQNMGDEFIDVISMAIKELKG